MSLLQKGTAILERLLQYFYLFLSSIQAHGLVAQLVEGKVTEGIDSTGGGGMGLRHVRRTNK